jgi:surface-anchored protein
MKILIQLFASLLVFAAAARVPAQCFQFTQEHVDLLSFVWDDTSDSLSLMAADDTHGGTLYASNQCVVICPETMKFTLPGGTPLGNQGDSLWILPQNPYDGVPYVGVSAERIAAGSFKDPLAIQLKRVEGPGQFMVWQSTSFGSFDIKMDTRDGIGPDDRLTPFVGGHEHHNWGFTTSGVYRVYFQASGVRQGQTTNTVSPETPFTFHVLPLPPFETWQSTNWPCECATNVIAAGADPDGDGTANAVEYAFGTNPTALSAIGWPTLSLVRTNGENYAVLSFTRVKEATDCIYGVLASDKIAGTNWTALGTWQSILDQGTTEKVTIRDDVALNSGRQRFYKLQIRLP